MAEQVGDETGELAEHETGLRGARRQRLKDRLRSRIRAAHAPQSPAQFTDEIERSIINGLARSGRSDLVRHFVAATLANEGDAAPSEESFAAMVILPFLRADAGIDRLALVETRDALKRAQAISGDVVIPLHARGNLAARVHKAVGLTVDVPDPGNKIAIPMAVARVRPVYGELFDVIHRLSARQRMELRELGGDLNCSLPLWVQRDWDQRSPDVRHAQTLIEATLRAVWDDALQTSAIRKQVAVLVDHHCKHPERPAPTLMPREIVAAAFGVSFDVVRNNDKSAAARGAQGCRDEYAEALTTLQHQHPAFLRPVAVSAWDYVCCWLRYDRGARRV